MKKKDTALYERLYETLRSHILMGYYRKEQVMPTFSEICLLHDVSIVTARKAMEKLLEDGYINSDKGRCFRVAYDCEAYEDRYKEELLYRRDAIYNVHCLIADWMAGCFAQGVALSKEEDWENLRRIANQIDPWQQSLQEILEKVNQYMEYLLGLLNNGLIQDLYRQSRSFAFIPPMKDSICAQELEDSFLHIRSRLLAIMHCVELRDTVEIKKRLHKKGHYDARKSRACINAQCGKREPEKTIDFSWEADTGNAHLSSHLAAELMQKICTQEYKDGALMPSIPTLARSYGMSNVTVRRALEMLQDLDVIKISQGKGTEVILYSRAESKTQITDTAIRRNLIKCLQSLQFLAMVGKDAGRNAAETVTEKDIAYLEEQLEKAVIVLRPFSQWVFSRQENPSVRMVFEQMLKVSTYGYHLYRTMPEKNLNKELKKRGMVLLSALKERTAERFAEHFQEAFIHCFRVAKERMLRLGISEVSEIPEPGRDCGVEEKRAVRC